MQKCLNQKAELPIKRWLGFFYWERRGEMKKTLMLILLLIMISAPYANSRIAD